VPVKVAAWIERVNPIGRGEDDIVIPTNGCSREDVMGLSESPLFGPVRVNGKEVSYLASGLDRTVGADRG
jgi:hypothetical protein